MSVAGGGGYVVDDSPDADAHRADLVAAGCPTIRSHEELQELVRVSRGDPKWEFVGDSSLQVWQDRWGELWLRSTNTSDVHGAVHLSKYEALGLGQKLVELAATAPHERE